jgi:aspartyl-tRNA(Asn)/glutamyl-tRNA(Gln) amidotransferase subunit B
MNSIRNVQRAIEHEIVRQIDLIESGEIVSQDTRSFDAVSGTTFSLRSKEMANDYRYFPEPDLQPVLVSEKYISEIKNLMPPLPAELFEKYIQLGLSDYDASVLIDDKYVALYFEELLKYTSNKKSAANWVMVNIKSYLNENAIHIQQFGVEPQKIAELIKLIDENKISNSVASQKILPLLIQFPEKSPLSIAEENNLIQESDSNLILEFAKEVIAKNPQKVAEYKSGKTGLIGLFMGELMKLSKGKADPKIGNSILKQLLDETID